MKQIWIFILTISVCFAIPFLGNASIATESPGITLAQTSDLEQQGQQLYESGQYQAAIEVLQRVIQTYESTGNTLQQAIALSNLALVYQQLGAWTEANQAIENSLALLQSPDRSTPDVNLVFAQTLNIQGSLQLAQGQPEAALSTWKQATEAFRQAGDTVAVTHTMLNQAQALRALGLYRQAITLLTDLNQSLQHESASLTQVAALQNLADALVVAGKLIEARHALEQGLTNLEQIKTGQGNTASEQASEIQEATANTYLSLGNLIRAESISTLNLSNLTPTEAIDRLSTPLTPTRSLTETAIARRQLEAAEAFYQQTETALSSYQQAAETAISAPTRIQAQLNQLRLFVETDRWQQAQTLYPELQKQLSAQPPSHDSIYAEVDLALSLIQIGLAESQPTSDQATSDSVNGVGSSPSLPVLQQAAQLLITADQQARSLADIRAQSYALGNLAGLYEQTQQWQEAESLTQQALVLSQSINATDISYLWQWQLGRILRARGNEQDAIAAYQESVNSLQSLRADLVAVNREVQFSFREKVEPVYREFVDLLLNPESKTNTIEATKLENLVKARDVIEGLQIAELDNFFREACLDTQFQIDRVVDQANLSTAILYTIVLPDRLEVILKLPHQPLLQYTTPVSSQTVEETVDHLSTELRRPFASRILEASAQQLYDWLIRPTEAALQDSQIDTLVFVLDGALRNIPMAALYDGQQYLIEQYSVAIAPGLQLPDPTRVQPQNLQALVAGLSEARNNFPPLTYVAQEIEQIQSDIPSQVLFNQDFTRENFQQLVNSSPFPIVHIATHGQFSSNASDTFILTWDEPINVTDLSTLLQAKDLTSPQPIELLVLSACQTAVGDRRATLGLAGVAVRAGARSTIASLWNLDDESSAVLMSSFYQELVNHAASKAEALRQAQLKLRSNPQYQSPRFWAPYVLLGNWL